MSSHRLSLGATPDSSPAHPLGRGSETPNVQHRSASGGVQLKPAVTWGVLPVARKASRGYHLSEVSGSPEGKDRDQEI